MEDMTFTIERLRSIGFSLHEAQQWATGGFTPAEAAMWRYGGFSPGQAARLTERAGATAYMWIFTGWAPEACIGAAGGQTALEPYISRSPMCRNGCAQS